MQVSPAGGTGHATDDKDSAFQSASSTNFFEPSRVASTATMQAAANETTPTTSMIPTISNQVSHRDTTAGPISQATTAASTATAALTSPVALSSRATSITNMLSSTSGTRNPPSNEETPPAYESVVNANPVGPPPSYEALFSRLKYIHRAQEKGILVPLISIAINLLLGILPLTMLIIGSIYSNQCPIDVRIAIWLIIYGALAFSVCMFLIGFSLYSMFRKNKNRRSKAAGLICCCPTFCVQFFLFIWFICGNVWVMQVRSSVVFSPADSVLYCHATLYTFAFWSIISIWIFSVLVVFCFCALCCACFFLCFKSQMSGVGAEMN